MKQPPNSVQNSPQTTGETQSLSGNHNATISSTTRELQGEINNQNIEMDTPNAHNNFSNSMSQFNERSEPEIRSACGSIHSGYDHSNQPNQSPIRSVDIKQDLHLTSVDSWIDKLNPVEDTRAFLCSYSEIDLITEFASAQILPQITITSFDDSPLDWRNFLVQFKEIIHDQPHLSGPQHISFTKSHW